MRGLTNSSVVVFVGAARDKVFLDAFRVVHGGLECRVPAVALGLVFGLELVCLGVNLERKFVLLGSLVYLCDVGLENGLVSLVWQS